MKLLGHISRHNNMERLVVHGRPERKSNKQDRSPTWWTDVISKFTETNVNKVTLQATDCLDLLDLTPTLGEHQAATDDL